MHKKRTGAGAATTAGTTFQENVAAWLVCQILAGPNRTDDLEMPADVQFETIECESLQPIDDIVVKATDRTLYFQCKTTLSIGENDNFVGVVRQFAGEFLKNGDPRDRYVLAVSDGASGVLRKSLRRVLRLIRGKRGEERVETLASGDTVSNEKYETLERVVREQLQVLCGGNPVVDEVVLSLIDRIMIYAAPFGAGACSPDSATDKLGLVLTKPEDAKRAWEHIVNVVRGFSPDRTGGVREDFVRDLRDEGLIAKPLAKVRDAIAALQARSHEHLSSLGRHTSIQCGDGRTVEIDRPIVNQIQQELKGGNLLLCGEAGAGKTGCLVQVARRLNHDHVPHLVIPVEQAFGDSDPHHSIGLPADVGLVEVLTAWPTDKAGVICLDGLDAARSAVSLRSVLDFVDQLRTVAPDWKVLASIREFDLEKSEEIQRMFRGTVSDTIASSTVADVRAIRVPELTEAEIRQLDSAVPTLREILAHENATGLRSLVKNVFNLDLLADLVASRIGQSELRQIDTQDKLLDVYWSYRVESDPNRTEPLATLTRKMVEKRRVAIHVQPELAAQLTELFSNSVLTMERGLLPEDPKLVRYRHNVLFDYAVSRLWLQGLNDRAVLIELATFPDLALVFRPSLRMTLQRLWRADSTREAFWSRVLIWFQIEGMTAIGRLSATQVASQEFRVVEDAALLLDGLDDTIKADLLEGTIAAALLQLRVDRDAFDIVGPEAAQWLLLVQTLADHDASRFSYTLRNVLSAVLDGDPDGRNKLTKWQKRSFTAIATKLLDVYIADGSDQILNRSLLGVAVRACVFAAAWDTEEAIAALRRALEPDFLATAGFVVLPLLGDQITDLADIDELIVEKMFEAYATVPMPAGDRITSLGGPILPMTSTAAQDLSMFEYSSGKVFQELVVSHPELAARVLRLILWHHWIRRESKLTRQPSDRTTEIDFEGQKRKYISDDSHIWDSDRKYDQHKLWRKAADAVFTVLKADETTNEVRQSLLKELLAVADLGAIWKRLLLAGASLSADFGQRLAPLLTQTVFLREFETRHAAGELLVHRFGTWDQELRARIESAIMQVGCEKFGEGSQDAATRLRDSLIVCLPEAAILTEEVRALSLRIRLEKSATPPSVAFRSFESGWISEEDDLREKGKLETETQSRFFELREEIKRLGRSNESLTADDVPPTLNTIAAYEGAIATAEADEISKEQTEYSEGEIAAAFKTLANVEGVPATERDLILSQLLKFATHSDPRHNEEDETHWDRPSPFWGSPFPRIEAAWGIMGFVRHAVAIDEPTRTAILRLSNDPVPAVRYPVIQCSYNAFKIDPDSFWKMIEHRVESEQRLALLACCVNVLASFSPKYENAERVDKLVRRIEARIAGRENAGFVRAAMVVHHLQRSIYLGDTLAQDWLDAVVASPLENAEELDELLQLWEELLSEPLSTDVFTDDEIVSLGIETLTRAFDNSHAAWGNKPWEGVEDDRVRSTYHRAIGPMERVVQTTSLLLDKLSHPKKPAPREDFERVGRIVTTFRPLIEKCITVPTPSEAYHFLQTLQYISPVTPTNTLLWVRTLIRSAEQQGFLSDQLGADLLIALLERYLVEHRGLLSGDAAVRNAMIDLLNDCVRFGWPKAGPLLVRLNEVFRA